MPRYPKLSREVREDIRRRFVRCSDEPEVEARQREMLIWLLSQFSEVPNGLLNKGIAKALRTALRQVLARRGLKLDPALDARIDACKRRATLRRWLDQAVTAASVDEVFTYQDPGSAHAQPSSTRATPNQE